MSTRCGLHAVDDRLNIHDAVQHRTATSFAHRVEPDSVQEPVVLHALEDLLTDAHQ